MPLAKNDYPQRLNIVDHSIVTWYLTFPPETTVEDIMVSDVWAATAGPQLRPFHRIKIDAEDISWTRTFVVTSVGTNSAVLALESEVLFDEAEKAVTTPDVPLYKEVWKGPVHKHQIVRLSDGAVVKKDVATKAECHRWIADRVKVEAA